MVKSAAGTRKTFYLLTSKNPTPSNDVEKMCLQKLKLSFLLSNLKLCVVLYVGYILYFGRAGCEQRAHTGVQCGVHSTLTTSLFTLQIKSAMTDTACHFLLISQKQLL